MLQQLPSCLLESTEMFRFLQRIKQPIFLQEWVNVSPVLYFSLIRTQLSCSVCQTRKIVDLPFNLSFQKTIYTTGTAVCWWSHETSKSMLFIHCNPPIIVFLHTTSTETVFEIGLQDSFRFLFGKLIVLKPVHVTTSRRFEKGK